MPAYRYDFALSAKLEDFVRRRYSDRLTNGILHFYFSLSYLERKRHLSPCAPMPAADHRALACELHRSLRHIGPALSKLELVGLIELIMGTPLRGSKRATQIRRRTLQELKTNECRDVLKDSTPVDAKRVCEVLNARNFVYGDENACKPSWNVGRTGRVYSSRPNVQKDTQEVRTASLQAGLSDGECLVNCDYKQADPSVIRHILAGHGFDASAWPDDPYVDLTRHLGLSRDDAKVEVNRLAYAKSAVAIAKHWHLPAGHFVLRYAQALDEYKAALWKSSKPVRGRRQVKTLGGTVITAERGAHIHPGSLLCWQAQGTVADILNRAVLELVRRETTDGWRVLFPVHDSVYVKARRGQEQDIELVMVAAAKEVGVELRVELNPNPSGTSNHRSFRAGTIAAQIAARYTVHQAGGTGPGVDGEVRLDLPDTGLRFEE